MVSNKFRFFHKKAQSMCQGARSWKIKCWLTTTIIYWRHCFRWWVWRTEKWSYPYSAKSFYQAFCRKTRAMNSNFICSGFPKSQFQYQGPTSTSKLASSVCCWASANKKMWASTSLTVSCRKAEEKMTARRKDTRDQDQGRAKTST